MIHIMSHSPSSYNLPQARHYIGGNPIRLYVDMILWNCTSKAVYRYCRNYKIYVEKYQR